MGSFFLVNLCLVVITMQFQETKAREIELMENSKGEPPLQSPKPVRTLIKLIQNFCNCKPQEEEHVHHHHHHVYHHHHFHHHLYNCFVPASPVIFTNTSSDSNFFPASSNVPKIQVEREEAVCSPSSVEDPVGFKDFLAPPVTEQSSRRSSKTSICSHTLSIHAEASSAVSVEDIVAQTKTSVTLNIPSSPTSSFFAFSSSNDASRRNSRSGKSEVSASTTVLAEINPQHERASTSQDEDSDSETNKEVRKSSIQRKDKELLKYRRFSQPAHVKLTRTPASGISSYNLSKRLDEKGGDYKEGEINPEMVHFDVLSSLESDLDKKEENRDMSSKDSVSERQDDDCQPADSLSGSLKRPSLHRRNVSSQSEDDMFESLFNLRQSATYDVTGNHGAWQRLRILCRKITESKQFTFFIMGSILLNMICMGLEHYKQVKFYVIKPST